MLLAPGTRVGAYEVIAPLGHGGMGEVYKARDTKLHRTVALKVLPERFAGDADRVARLRREAQLLASLNHPNIAAIHGFEDSGDLHALVMEFVDGRDLSAIGREPRRPLTIDDALAIARQIAVALEAAHDQGIVHRDLKPANIKITADGTVKVLDFGLAKAMADANRDAVAADAELETVTSPAITHQGVILGTAGYMSPEQAKGKPVDRRADIWAFGVVLFELLSGAPLYRGETVTDTIAKVITQSAPWDALPSATPGPIRRLLRRCLEKDPRNRYQSAGDIRIDIDEFVAAPSAESVPGPAPPATTPLWRRVLPWTIAAGLLIALTVTAWPSAPHPAQTIRLETRLGAGEGLVLDENSDGALTIVAPDGTALVYAGNTDKGRRLYYRALDRLESTALPGSAGASSHFFSSDGRSIGYFADGALKRMPIAGGAPITLAQASNPRGGTWGPDDTIVYAPDISTGLWRVSASGAGSPTEVTTLQAGERTHRWPSFLPGGRTVLFGCQLNSGSYDDGTIEALRLDTRERKVLVRGGTFPRYVASGHLVYMRQDTLFALTFDPQTLEVRGEPKPVFGGIVSGGSAVGGSTAGNGAAQISFADTGTVVYLAGTPVKPLSRLTVLDRSGKPIQSVPGTREYRNPRFSPNGRQIAVQVSDSKVDSVYLFDRDRDTLGRMTVDGSPSGFPVWSFDGRHIAYYREHPGKGFDVYLMRADGAGDARPLTSGALTLVPGSFVPDGKTIVVMEQNPKTGMDLISVGLEDRTTSPILNSTANEMLPAVSPDGKWLAYQADEAAPGSFDVFVRTYPGSGAKRQVSTTGGVTPFWTKQGKELVYCAGGPTVWSVMAVDVSVQGEALLFGNPHKLFDVTLAVPANGIALAASADGNQFTALLPDQSALPAKQTHVTIVFNFFEEIRRALGTRR